MKDSNFIVPIIPNIYDGQIWDISKIPVSTLFRDFIVAPKNYDKASKDYVRCLVLRGPISICAYVGVLCHNRLFGKDTRELVDEIEVHCGFTYSCDSAPPVIGLDKCDDHKMWWFGWDYGHASDWTFHQISQEKGTSGYTGISGYIRKHTINDVSLECVNAAQQFLKYYPIPSRKFRMIRMEV